MRAGGRLASKMTGFPEGKVSTALGVRFRVSENDVIHQLDFENLGGLPQNPRTRMSAWLGPGHRSDASIDGEIHANNE